MNMPEPTKPARVYGDKEIGQILKRATELQQAEPNLGPGGGMTLAELEEVASEAGISLDHLRRAALEIDTGAPASSFWAPLLGEDVGLVREVTLPGEVPRERFEDLLGTIQGTVSDHGQPTLVGRTLTWQGQAADQNRRIRVVVSSRDDATLIRIEENLSQMAGGLFGGVVGGVGLGVGLGMGLPFALSVLGSAAAAVVFPAATVGLTYIGVREAYRRVVQRRRRAMDHLLGRLVQAAQDAIAAGAEDGR